MKKLSKILVPILAIALVLCAFFVVASASADSGYEASVGTKKYETFEEAVKAANKADEGVVVKVLGPVVVEEQLEIVNSMTIDLGGNFVTYQPEDYFQTFMTVNAVKAGKAVTLTITGDGCVDVMNARLFNLKSTAATPASLVIEGTDGGYGTYVHHQGDYASIMASESASVTIEGASFYINGDCVDKNGYKDIPAKFQLDGANITFTVKNAEIECLNNSTSLFRIIGSGTGISFVNSTVKTTGTLLGAGAGINEGNASFVIVNALDSVLTAQNEAGGDDALFRMSSNPFSGTINVKDSRLASPKTVISSQNLDDTAHRIYLNLDNCDVTAGTSGSSYVFVTGHVYVNAENCHIASNGTLGSQTTPDHFTFTDCVFSDKAADGDGALTGGAWYFTYADPSYPWAYLTEAPATEDNADYLYTYSFDGVIFDYYGGHLDSNKDYVPATDRNGIFARTFESTIKLGYAQTETLDGNSYFKYEMVDPYAGTDKASDDGKIAYSSSYFPEQQGGYDAYYVFGPGYTSNFNNALFKLTDYETIVFDFDFKGTEFGYAPVYSSLYHRNESNAQTNHEVFSTDGNTVKIGTKSFTVDDPTMWHHLQIIYYIAETTEETGRSYVGQVALYFDGELKDTVAFNYGSAKPEDLYLGGLRNTVRGSQANIGAAICYDNLTIRAYKNEAARVTVNPSVSHKEDVERSGVMIGNTIYNSLEEALNAAQPSDTLVLYKDVSSENINLTKSVKIVSNGYALPSFNYIDNENATVYSYSPIYSANAPYKVLVIDAEYHPMYLYPSLTTDFVVIRDGLITGAGNGGDVLATMISKLKSGDTIHIKRDITVSSTLEIKVSNITIDLEGVTLNVGEDVKNLFNLANEDASLRIYASKPGAVINAPGNTRIFNFAGVRATVDIGKYTDVSSGKVYAGENITVNAVTLAYTNKTYTKLNVDGGVYNCIGYNPSVLGFVYSACTTSANCPVFNLNNATFTLNDSENALSLFGINPKTRIGRLTYSSYAISNLDGCTVYGSETGDGVNMHTVAGLLSSNSAINISNSYLYGVAILRDATNAGTLTLHRGNFSTVPFGVIGDGETASNAAFATGIEARGLDKTVPMAFASAEQTEISVNGEALALSSLNTPLAYYTGAQDDVFVKYVIGSYTSRMIITEAGADLESSSIVPSEVYAHVAPSIKGLYEVACVTESQKTGDDGVVTVTLKSEKSDKLSTLSTLQLYDSLNYVVYIPKDAIVSGVIETITVDGKIVYTAGDDVKYVTIADTDYMYIIKEVGAANASTEFELAVTHGYIGYEGTNTQRQTLSLEKYAKSVLDSATVNDAGKQLVCDVLYYVNTIRTYTGEAISATDGIKTLIADYTAAGYAPMAEGGLVASANTAKKDITSESVKAALDYVAVNITKDAANIRFCFDENYEGTVTLTYKNLAGEDVITVINVSELEDGYYDLDLRAYYLISDITITTDAAEETGNVYNFASYVSYIAATYPDSAVADLVEALYAYGLSAKAYNG